MEIFSKQLLYHKKMSPLLWPNKQIFHGDMGVRKEDLEGMSIWVCLLCNNGLILRGCVLLMRCNIGQCCAFFSFYNLIVLLLRHGSNISKMSAKVLINSAIQTSFYIGQQYTKQHKCKSKLTKNCFCLDYNLILAISTLRETLKLTLCGLQSGSNILKDINFYP